MVGAPFISKVEIDTTVSCGDDFKGKVYSSDLSNPGSTDNLVSESDPMKIFFPAGLCPTQQLEVRLLSPRCFNPMVPECSDLIVKESYKISGYELSWLDSLDDTDGLPCQK